MKDIFYDFVVLSHKTDSKITARSNSIVFITRSYSDYKNRSKEKPAQFLYHNQRRKRRWGGKDERKEGEYEEEERSVARSISIPTTTSVSGCKRVDDKV